MLTAKQVELPYHEELTWTVSRELAASAPVGSQRSQLAVELRKQEAGNDSRKEHHGGCEEHWAQRLGV